MIRVVQTASISHRFRPSIEAKCEFVPSSFRRHGRQWSFFVTAVGLCSVSGRFAGRSHSQTFTLFVDDAEIYDVNHEGAPWCSNVMRLRLHFEPGALDAVAANGAAFAYGDEGERRPNPGRRAASAVRPATRTLDRSR
jgi:hypothetical protein